MQLNELAGTECSKHHKLVKVIGRLAFCAELPISERCTNETLLQQGGDANERGDEQQSTPARPDTASPAALNGGSGHARNSKAPAGKTEAASGDEAMLRDDKLGDGTKQGTYTNGNGHGQVSKHEVDLLRRVPPQDLDAEKAVLGSIFLVNESIEAANRLLTVQDFYREAHRVLFKAMQALWRAKTGIDAVTLGAQLTQEELKGVGGSNYLLELAIFVPTAQHIEHYAGIVRGKARNRAIATIATEIASMAYEGVSSDAVLGEWERQLKPLTESNGPNHLPELIQRDITLWSGREFHMRHVDKPARSWLVEGMLARKEISLWSGKVEHGKTTLMRTLVMCLMRGEFFLGRHTYPSRIMYVMLDADGEDLTYEEFGRLGIDWDHDPIDLIIDPVMSLRPHSFAQFHGLLLDRKPDLVIVDPIGRFQKIEESDGGFNGYGMTYAMAQFSELAKQTNCHMCLMHHIPRGRSDDDDAATAGFGSIAIAGGCNARFTVLKKGPAHLFRTSKGKGGGFLPFEGDQLLAMDEQTHWITLVGGWDWKAEAHAIMPAVLTAIEQSDDELTAQELGRMVGVKRSIAGAAAKMLENDDKIAFRRGAHNKHFYFRKTLRIEGQTA